jgi:hypothetical protein
MPKKFDHITDALTKLEGDKLTPRLLASRDDRIQLILSCGGPRTARSIRKSKSQLPETRIPHLFSAIDTQTVIDILHNDLDELIEELIRSKKR